MSGAPVNSTHTGFEVQPWVPQVCTARSGLSINGNVSGAPVNHNNCYVRHAVLGLPTDRVGSEALATSMAQVVSGQHHCPPIDGVNVQGDPVKSQTNMSTYTASTRQLAPETNVGPNFWPPRTSRPSNAASGNMNTLQLCGNEHDNNNINSEIHAGASKDQEEVANSEFNQSSSRQRQVGENTKVTHLLLNIVQMIINKESNQEILKKIYDLIAILVNEE